MTEMQPEDEVLDAITRVRVRYGLPSASLASQPFRFDPTWRRYAMLGRRIPCEPLGESERPTASRRAVAFFL